MNRTQSNVTVYLNPERLDRQLATVNARQLHSVVARLVGVPTDVTSVVLRVFTPGLGSFFDVPVSMRPDGFTGICYAIGTCFPTVGTAKYEIHAFDAHGNSTALGTGKVEVKEFSASGVPIEPGAEVVLDRIKDSSGNYHTIKAVPDGAGGYTTIVDAN